MEYFFVNPGNQKDLKNRLLSDIKKANEKILMAVGFLNDKDLIKAIRENKNVKEKRVVLNAVDVEYAVKNAEKKGKSKPANQEWVDDKLYVVTLGNSESYNHMHHKFLILDKDVWIGSYNFTYAAMQKNWESMLLVKDNPDLLKDFETEFNRMYRLGIFFNENVKCYIKDNKCIHCNQELTDSHNHFFLKETLYLEKTVGMDYYSGKPVERLLNSSTSYDVECINKNSRLNPTMNRKCDKCDEVCTPYDITESRTNKSFTNDGSVEFSEGFNEYLHKDELTTSFKCPECFIKETQRSLHYDFWYPGLPIPDYK